MLLIDGGDQKINQMLVMVLLWEYQYINDTIHVRILNDVDKLHKEVSIQERQLLNDNDYHLINLVDGYNNYLLNQLNDEIIEVLI